MEFKIHDSNRFPQKFFRMLLLLLLFVVCFVAVVSCTTTTTTARKDNESPIVLVPGLGGSALEMRIQGQKPSVRHFWCAKTTRGKWERIWLDPTQLIPKQIDCWNDNMKLRYTSSQQQEETNSTTTPPPPRQQHPQRRTGTQLRGGVGANKEEEEEEEWSDSFLMMARHESSSSSSQVHNAPGVEIRAVPGIQGLNLLPSSSGGNAYKPLVDRFANLQAFTYDFRLSPAGNPQFHEDLQQLIETAFGRQDNRRVTLVTHSYGCLWVHHFLTTHVTEEWKERHIEAWVPLSPAYGGVPASLLEIVTGDTLGIPFLRPQDVRDQQRNDESALWLLPDPRLYSLDTLVETPHANYTAQNYVDLFRAIYFEDGPLIYDRVCHLTPWTNDNRLTDPNVTVYPVYGTNVSTSVKFVYNDGLQHPPSATVKIMDGDGTVVLRSLAAGNGWSQAHAPLILDGQDHNQVLANPHTLRLLETIVLGDDN